MTPAGRRGVTAGGNPASGTPAFVAAAACAGNPIAFSASNAAQAIPGLSVTFDNGSVGRMALIDLSANLGVDVDAEVRVAYSVDGGAARSSGPAVGSAVRAPPLGPAMTWPRYGNAVAVPHLCHMRPATDRLAAGMTHLRAACASQEDECRVCDVSRRRERLQTRHLA